MARGLSDRGLEGGGFAVLERHPSIHLLGRHIAREYSREHATPPATDLLAWEQTAGPGRRAHTWASPPGGLYVTLIRSLVMDSGPQVLAPLVATALCDALNVDLDGRCRLRWPDDVLVDGLKLGGILVAASSLEPIPGSPDSKSTECLAVISFGIHHQQFPDPGTTSLEREVPGAVPAAELAVRMIEAVDAVLGEPAVEESVERYRRLSVHQPGDSLTCHQPDDEIEGVFQGFEHDGRLRLRVGDEERLFSAVGAIDDDG